MTVDIKAEEIKQLYENGLSSVDISELVPLSPSGIRYRLKRGGVRIRSKEEAIRLALKKGKSYQGDKGENNHNWKGGKYLTPQGYYRIHHPNHPRAHRGYVFEHIQVWEKANGRPLPEGFVVHHINGIRSDNRPENLLAMTWALHRKRELGEALKNAYES